MPDGPLADPIEEAGRIAEAAKKAGVKVKLLGGAGIHLHSPSAARPPLKRKYGDLDYAMSKKDRKAVLALFPSLGYEANERFNLMNGDTRLYFYDAAHGRQVDVFIDVFKMSHVIDLRGRLDGDGPCATPSDLLLSKLQIYEVNRKDLIDVIALLLDHPIGDGEDAIDAAYLTRLACADWGLCRTVELNFPKLLHVLDELDVDRELVRSRVQELQAAIAAGPKPLKWRLRAQVGDRVQWYELPEETRSPYQPE
ncbi:MAG TPA: nucleotidyltransferase family protein [Candidatus Dormibacteraeota bacterium]|nr:nucleotidyltransferase family protein [Candidatus Dormibacteraeota bacterium]